ncbi:DUF6029 family protein [Flavobacterium sp.]|jgi:hypothetical protein|uniref:DUF6029 family protein n=1 Tax=Flavobacterium sp. TaxID=239 RepID=UPI0037BEE5E6
MKLINYILVFGLSTLTLHAQEKKDMGRFFGGFETNAQRYLEFENDENSPEYFRSNNYLQLNYEVKKWTFGMQVESYEKQALLNYYPGFDGTNVATYFAKYKTKKLEATAGYFYEQFGSGMILRAWEDRSLGINTALRGGKVFYKPTKDIKFKAFYGQQRSGFKVSEGHLYGFDLETNLSDLLSFEEADFEIGFSNVNRYEKIDQSMVLHPSFSPTTHAFSLRSAFSQGIFYSSFEANYKSKDATLNRITNSISNDFINDGNALQFNLGIAKDGLGIDLTLRRTQNMLFTSERIPEAVGLNQSSLDYSDKVINFTPALTKQHHSNLANIYVYQAQAGVEFKSNEIMKSGETGGQLDVVYEFAKDTKLGGKYGTKLALNYASWYNLPGTYRAVPAQYETNFFGVGEKYFSDFNIEVKKQFSENSRASFLYVNQYYNKPWVEDASHDVNTHIFYGEWIYSLTKSKSIRVDVEHMWADADFKNWMGGSMEYNFNEKFSVYAMDLINYGNTKDKEERKKHYLTIGGAYRKGATRVALGYGRQRGGLVCVGGVCRFVPESTGISLSFNTAF